MRSKGILIGLGALALAARLMGVSGAWAAPGDLDPSFGNDGIVSTPGGSPGAQGMVIQPDGKIVVVGSQGDFNVLRYLTDGSLDPSFDFDGRATAPFDVWPGVAEAVVLQPDGKIVVAGSAGYVPYQQDPIGDFALARFNPDGSLDETFGTGGTVTTDFFYPLFEGQDAAFALALQGDGKIVAAGFANYIWTANPVPGGQPRLVNRGDFALARYNNDGSLDLTFGTDGMLTTEFADVRGGGIAHALITQPDNKIVAGGEAVSGISSYYHPVLVRYQEDGALDPSFGNGGLVQETETGGSANGLDSME